ncbi:hypothetical protein AB1Y20_007974 [Prymnesium parvum]|uniref:Uncharacterized protein n=1 Tax=Prymnesium parvum TaxID=97485 RepID=A0AB34IV22_PRYPA
MCARLAARARGGAAHITQDPGPGGEDPHPAGDGALRASTHRRAPVCACTARTVPITSQGSPPHRAHGTDPTTVPRGPGTRVTISKCGAAGTNGSNAGSNAKSRDAKSGDSSLGDTDASDISRTTSCSSGDGVSRTPSSSTNDVSYVVIELEQLS